MIGSFSMVSHIYISSRPNCSYILVAAVCHHGGAGTTAAGLRAGKPTIIVPFFGDQFFWGSMISKSGAGPPPMPGKTITAKQLASAFDFVHEPETQAAALKVSTNFQSEKGCEVAVKSFQAHLPVQKMRSDLDPSFGACFQLEKHHLRLSRPVAQVLVAAGAIEESDLSALSVYNWHTLISNNHFEGVSRGFKRAVSKITDSVSRVRRSRSLSAVDKSTTNRTKREAVNLGRPFKECLPLYGEIKEKTDEELAEKEISDERIRHSVHYGLALLISKPYGVDEKDKETATAMVVNSAKRNTARTQGNNKSIVRRLSNRLNQRSNNQRPVVSKEKTNQKSAEQKAADMTGLSLEVCRKIISRYEEIQNERRRIHEGNRSPHRIRFSRSLYRSHSQITFDD